MEVSVSPPFGTTYLEQRFYLPDGTFTHASVTNSVLNMQCNVLLEYSMNVTIFLLYTLSRL